MSGKGFHFIRTFTCVVMGLAMTSSCAPARKGGVVQDCVLFPDQASTLNGHWPVYPIPIAFHTDFADYELEPMLNAADTWNKFYGQSLGINVILDYGTRTSPHRSTQSRVDPRIFCTTPTLNGHTFQKQIVIYKAMTWSSDQANVMAYTHQCPTATASPLPFLSGAMLELNYANFFVAGKKIPDMQTILLHEFGHLLGLAHSCDDKSSSTSFVSCSNSKMNVSYRNAVMYPTFDFSANGYGIAKRTLNENDQGRANCLYMPESYQQ